MKGSKPLGIMIWTHSDWFWLLAFGCAQYTGHWNILCPDHFFRMCYGWIPVKVHRYAAGAVFGYGKLPPSNHKLLKPLSGL